MYPYVYSKAFLLFLHYPARLRTAACRGLSWMKGSEEAVAMLGERTLCDTSFAVRIATAHALARLGGARALALLERAAQDNDPNVRASVARLLGDLSR